jgi:hypothetical protein
MESFKLNYSIIICICFLVSYHVNSQNKERSKRVINYATSTIKIGVNYSNDEVFMGRKDSISAPYLYTSLEYKNKTGIYVSGAFSFLTKSESNYIDVYLFSTGYNFYKNDFFADISVSAYFFNKASYTITSKVIADLTTQLQYDFSFANIGLISSVYFNEDSNSDFFLTPQLSYDFITKNDKFQFSPTFSLNLGSQNFYQEFLIENNGYGWNSKYGDYDDEDYVEIIFEEKKKFNVLAYELSLPIWYIEKSYFIFCNLSLAFPKNEANILIDESVLNKKSNNTFNWLIGFNYQFKS